MGGRGSSLKANNKNNGSGASNSNDNVFAHGVFNRWNAVDFMNNHNASQFSIEQFDNINIDGVEFAPISYNQSGSRIVNSFQAQTPNVNGEYTVFQVVVIKKSYKRGTVYQWDRSSVGTKFD